MVITNLIYLVIASMTVKAQELQCNIEGLCQGIVVGADIADSYNECLDLCTENDNCNWITFLEDTNECMELYDCPFLDATCRNCFSGQVECPPLEPICNALGFCNGHLIIANITATAEDCLRYCQSVDGCNWYSYFPDNQNCVLTEDCLLFDDSCTNCVAGEKECQPIAPVYNKLFIVGGVIANNKVELVDLSGQGTSCPTLPAYTAATHGSAGVFIGNHPLVCGGLNVTAVRDCLLYNPSLNTWQQSQSMLQPRYMAAAVQMSPTQWWVTGGNSISTMSLTEMYTVGEGFSTFVNLPQARSYHNLVKINSTHVVLLGETWSSLPDLLFATSGTQAGLITYPDGRKEVVVVAGFDTDSTQIFSLDTMTWRRGPDFPAGRLHDGSSVPYGDTFLVVGGRSEGVYLNSIYSFNVESQAWDELPYTMTLARSSFAAFTVPNNYDVCP